MQIPVQPVDVGLPLPEHLGIQAVSYTHLDVYKRQVYARIEGLLASVESWIRRMKTALLDGGDCQSLLNCSESMLQNFVMVSNSDFRLLAYTQHIPIDDPTTKLVIEQGVHPCLLYTSPSTFSSLPSLTYSNNPHELWPVSYTHLDVYKRQPSCATRYAQGAQSTCFGFAANSFARSSSDPNFMQNA